MIDSINDLLTWFTSGIYDFVVETYAYIIIKITLFKYSMMKSSLMFSFDIAQEIMQQLNITSEISSLLNMLPAETVQQLNFFNVITGLNLLLNAAVTRFVIGFRG